MPDLTKTGSREVADLKLKVWWMPQIPMKCFEFEVSSIEEGRKFMDVLANYDLFQFENNVKPDYANTGGIVYSHPLIEGGDWLDVPEDDDEVAGMLAEIRDAEAANA
jgi:hypothetical protein